MRCATRTSPTGEKGPKHESGLKSDPHDEAQKDRDAHVALLDRIVASMNQADAGSGGNVVAAWSALIHDPLHTG